MMTYKEANYETFEDLRNALNSELAALAYPYAVKHRFFGEGQLTFIKAPLTGKSLYATIDFVTGSKTISLDVVLANDLLEMPEILYDILVEAQSAYKAGFEEDQQAKIAAKRLAREQEAALKKKEEADKKAEEKYESTKLKTIRDFNNLVHEVRPKSTNDEFYYSLGWLTAHVGAVQAAIPDYLQPSFEAKFGTEANPYVYDSKKKTSGGFRYQWSAGFHARLKKKGLTTIPALLAEHVRGTNNSSKTVMDTAFISDLVENYGFQFGKTQDVDKIKSYVPSEYLSSFEAGLIA
jgi:hypothetical protein